MVVKFQRIALSRLVPAGNDSFGLTWLSKAISILYTTWVCH